MYGCTVLGDGSLIPAIDAAALVSYVQKQQLTTNTLAVSTNTTPQAIQIPTVMVIDDSTMMRRTLALTFNQNNDRKFSTTMFLLR
jgi:two-component system, chemotaxis family, sensor histidine kinase and response regulator PixL